MKVYIDARHVDDNLWPILDNEPVALIKICGKYLIEYLLESCSEAGISSVYVATGKFSSIFVDKIGAGGRWGLNIIYSDGIPDDNDLLAIDSNCLYDFNLLDLIKLPIAHRNNFLLSSLASNKVFPINSYASFHYVCMRFINEGFVNRAVDPHQNGYRVIQGSRVKFNPENIVDGRLFVGDSSSLSPTITIKGGVVIGSNVIVDDFSKVSNSIIMDNSYVGKMVKVDNSIVKGEYLLNPESGACAKIVDDLLLADLTRDKQYGSWAARVRKVVSAA